MDDDGHARVFGEHRAALFRAAYGILGSVADSEDAVQETWLRWREKELDAIERPRSYLLTAVTRTALNIVRSAERRRESYVGPWLPEPMSTGEGADPPHSVEVAEDVSLAMLVVLESLSPLERAVFVLREVFDSSYADIACALDKSEASVRQLVHRARSHVRERAPRYPVDPDAQFRVAEMFLEVARGTVAVDELLGALSPDIVLTTDAGGHASAARRPISGASKVVRFTAGILSKPDTQALEWQIAEVNGAPALVGHLGGAVDTVVWFEIDGDRVTRVDMVRNPEKLAHVRV